MERDPDPEYECSTGDLPNAVPLPVMPTSLGEVEERVETPMGSVGMREDREGFFTGAAAEAGDDDDDDDDDDDGEDERDEAEMGM